METLLGDRGYGASVNANLGIFYKIAKRDDYSFIGTGAVTFFGSSGAGASSAGASLGLAGPVASSAGALLCSTSLGERSDLLQICHAKCTIFRPFLTHSPPNHRIVARAKWE